MYKHLLVATDGSALSNKAVDTAIELARHLGARLSGFHATQDFPIETFSEYAVLSDGLSPASWKAEQEKRARTILDKVEVKARKAGVNCATNFNASLHPYEAIIKAAKKSRCDLIIMASHGRRGIAGIVLGSETHKVLTHSKLPVLVCH